MTSINKEGYIFIAVLFLVCCFSFSVSLVLGVFFFFATALCIYFFRDPIRIVPSSESVIVSPADGLISKISETESPVGSNSKVNCISIFLSVFNVHVNRIPISGTIKSKEYNSGRFLSAHLDKSATENERQRIVIEAFNGDNIIVEQIAGLIARRIVCSVKEDQVVTIGERFGIIRFGSRVNLYLPLNIKIAVKEGQTLVGGETIISDLTREIIDYENFDSI